METMHKIVSLIEETGCEQKDFCKAIGIKPSLMSDWKSGRNKSYPKYLPQIANYFGVSVDYLLGLTSDRKSADYEVSVDDMLKLYDIMTDAQKSEFIVRFNKFINKRRKWYQKTNQQLLILTPFSS